MSEPRLVRGRELLTDGPRYFPYRYRLRAPDLGMDVWSDPWVDAPAHQLPIEYWTGPVTLTGRLFDQPVSGLGFDERSRPRIHGFEIAEELRLTVEHMDGLAPDTKALLASRAWEVESLALRDAAGAHAHVTTHVQPLLADLPEAARDRVTAIVHDLVGVLASRRRLP